MKRTVSIVYDMRRHYNVIGNGGLFSFLWYARAISKLRKASGVLHSTEISHSLFVGLTAARYFDLC